jgi:hypothetical protein
MAAMGLGAVLLVKALRHRHQTGPCEKLGKSIDERLKESKLALDKATMQVQNVFEHIKNRKP